MESRVLKKPINKQQQGAPTTSCLGQYLFKTTKKEFTKRKHGLVNEMINNSVMIGVPGGEFLERLLMAHVSPCRPQPAQRHRSLSPAWKRPDQMDPFRYKRLRLILILRGTHFGLEVDPVALLPHLGLHRLTRYHRLCKADLKTKSKII